jgi:hypothetical protein
MVANPILYSQLHPNTKEEEEKEEERAEESKEEEEKNFIPPSLIASAILLRVGRKRAPIMKILEAEKAPKLGRKVGLGR